MCLAGHTVAMVAYCVAKMITMCSPMVGQFLDTLIVASIDKEWHVIIIVLPKKVIKCSYMHECHRTTVCRIFVLQRSDCQSIFHKFVPLQIFTTEV